MPVILCMPELPLKLQVLETHAMFISLAMAPQGMPQWLLRIKWNNHDRKSFLLPFSAPGSLDLAVETLKASHQSNLLDYCFWLTRTCCLLREWHRGAALGQEGHLAWMGSEFLFMTEEKRMKLCEKIQCLEKLLQQTLVLRIGVIWHILQTNFHNNFKKLFNS